MCYIGLPIQVVLLCPDFETAEHYIGAKLDVEDSYTITRSNAVAFELNGKGYIGTGSFNGIRSDFWEYNPNTDTWIEVTSLEGAARQDAIAFSIGEKAFVATGRNGNYYFDDIWYFEPGAIYNEED